MGQCPSIWSFFFWKASLRCFRIKSRSKQECWFINVGTVVGGDNGGKVNGLDSGEDIGEGFGEVLIGDFDSI